MKDTLTDITVLLDRSGSMASVRDDTIGGFNTFIDKQRQAPGDAVVTLVQFDDEWEPNYFGRSIKDEGLHLSRATYEPRGSTALYDALCRLIDETGHRLEKMAEGVRPGLVIFVIITDGQENASIKFKDNPQAVTERITKQRDVYSWQFVFLGANQDAIASAGRIGIVPQFAMNYAQNTKGVVGAYTMATENITSARMVRSAGGSVGAAASALSWTPEQRKEQDEEIDKTTGGTMFTDKSTGTDGGC